MRLLPCIRLSVFDDESTSPERQIGRIEKYAELGDHTLVETTEADYDLDVSGAVSPFDRPGIGKWLKPEHLDDWDGLIVAKLDRLTRSLIHFVTFVSWLEANGKTLVCLDPMLDLTTPGGRAFAQILVTFAEYERETIAARVRDAWIKLQADGKYAGGQVPFGYRPVKLGKGWGYEPDPVYGPIVAEMADRYLRYQGLGSIARWLNESGVPTPWNVTRIRNGKKVKPSLWTATTVRKILSRPAILGATVKTDGEPVRDADGVVLYRAEPLVTRDVYERVQARLRENPVSAKVNTWALTQIAFCAACEAPMYGSTATYGDKTYRYYVCMHSMRRWSGKCRARRVKAAELEEAVFGKLVELTGDVELTEDRLIPGRDYSEEIARTVEQMAHLFKEIQLGALSGQDVREKQEALARAQEELTQLNAFKPVAPRTETMGTGKTFAQTWAELDATGRNEFLRATEVRAYVQRWDGVPDEYGGADLSAIYTRDVTVVTAPHGGATPDLAGDRTVTMTGHGMKIVLDIGKIAELRDRAGRV